MNVTNNKIRCVIFDCDGVLVDSERLCCQALADVFTAYGANTTASEFMQHFQGGQLADILSQARQRLQISASLDQLLPRYRMALEKLYQKELKPVAGVCQVLDRCDRNQVDYCVVSNNPRSKIERNLDLAGLLPRFDGMYFSAFEANSWKPEPDLLLYSMMHMGYSAEECIYIDDTLAGVEAGVRAGITTYHFREQERGVRSYLGQVNEISDMRQLLNILNLS